MPKKTNPLFVIILIVAVILIFKYSNSGLFSAIELEAQSKEQYYTYWSDIADDAIPKIDCEIFNLGTYYGDPSCITGCSGTQVGTDANGCPLYETITTSQVYSCEVGCQTSSTTGSTVCDSCKFDVGGQVTSCWVTGGSAKDKGCSVVDATTIDCGGCTDGVGCYNTECQANYKINCGGTTYSVPADTAYYNRREEMINNGDVGCIKFLSEQTPTQNMMFSASEKWICEVPVTANGGSDYSSIGGSIILSSDVGSYVYCETREDFSGEEIVIVLNSGVDLNDEGSCSVTPYGLFKGEGTVITYIPYTFSNSYDVFQDGLRISKGVNIDTFKVRIQCYGAVPTLHPIVGTLEFIGFQPEYACDLSMDEVWLTERYGSQMTRDDLTFIPTKFCDEIHPATLRTPEGETAIYPNPYYALNRGEIIPDRALEADEELTIRYATYYVSGVIDPLPPNQEWYCTARDVNNKCTNWVAQDYVQPIQIVQCTQDSDCATQCEGVTASCVSNVCSFTGSCLQPPQIEESGTNLWTLIQDAFLGLWNFILSIFGG